MSEQENSVKKEAKEFLYLKQYKRKASIIHFIFTKKNMLIVIGVILTRLPGIPPHVFILSSGVALIYVLYSYIQADIGYRETLKKDQKLLNFTSAFNKFKVNGYKNLFSLLLLISFLQIDLNASFASAIKETTNVTEKHIEVTEKEELDFIEHLKMKAITVYFLIEQSAFIQSVSQRIDVAEELIQNKIKTQLNTLTPTKETNE